MEENESPSRGNYENNLSGPHIRNIYLKKSAEEYENNNFPGCTTYQVNAMCINFHNTYLREYRNHNLDRNFFHSKDSCEEGNKLVKYGKKYLKINNENSDHLNESNFKYQEDEVLQVCKQMPHEWTIIQLCKGYYPKSTFSLKNEIMTQNCPLYLTLLSHTRKDIESGPLCFKIETTNHRNIYEKMFDLTTEIRNKCSFEGDDNKKNRAIYWDGMQVLNDNIKRIIEDLREIFEPYIFFFAGEATTEQLVEARIFRKVDVLCQKLRLSKQQQVFLSMLARRVNDLSTKSIKSSLTEMFNMGETEENETPLSEIYNFLQTLKDEKGVKIRYKPCIVIVDELIDHFFWEMLVPDQEICRVSSLRILETLYSNYKDKVSGGYLKIKVSNGNYLLNPDGTLVKMENRMAKFFEYWLPNWKFLVGKLPTEEKLTKLLTTGEVYVYCGHGSSLQFLSGHKVAKLVTSSVVFLFGCDSVRLKSEGWHSELTGSHLYFNAALCPAVIGSLIIALDFQMDKMSTKVLSSWITSNKKLHWNQVDKKAWRKGQDFLKTPENTRESNNQYQPSLPLVLSNLRCDPDEAHYNKTSLVLRGLPVWNILAE